MADEHAVEPPPGTPGQRALGAMESAVRRARAVVGTPPPPSETEGATAERPGPLTERQETPPPGRLETPPPPTVVVSAEAAAATFQRDIVQNTASVRSARPTPPPTVGDVRILDGAPLSDAPRREDTLELPETEARPVASTNRWLIGAIAVLAALVIAAGIALIVSLGGGSTPPSRTAANPAPTNVPPARTPTTIPTGSGKQQTTSTTPSTTVPSTSPPASTSTTTAAGVVPVGPPTIASLSPASGSTGQTITVTGANFLSSSGQIVATFNGAVAPTSCPAQNTCTLTVPASTSPSAQVVITTSGGTSNAMTFTYS